MDEISALKYAVRLAISESQISSRKNCKVRLERIYEGFRVGGMDAASNDIKHLLLMPLKRGFFCDVI